MSSSQDSESRHHETDWIGRALPRLEDAALVKGEGKFVADIHLPNTCHAVFVRSPVPHARVGAIDTTAAKALEGVIAVFTPSDVPRTPIPPFLWDSAPQRITDEIRPRIKRREAFLLPADKVRYVGEAVAMVVAETQYLAEDAAQLVDVDYDILPSVPSADAALKPGATLVNEEWGDNVAATFTVSAGEPRAAFEAADRIIHGDFSIQRQVGLPLETRGAVASVDPVTGEVTLWSSTQNVHPLQRSVATLVGLPRRLVRVIAPDVGGGFGTKGILYVEDPLVAFAALALHRPVKWVEDRIEHMQAAIHARDQKHHIELALSQSGHILGLRDRFTVNNGAYMHLEIAMPYNTIHHLLGPYRIPNFEAEVTSVVTTTTPTAPYRGAGRPEATFALERAIEQGARAVGMDPLDFRRQNLIRPSEMPFDTGILHYRTGEQLVLDGGDFPRMLDEAAQLVGYEPERIRALRSTGRDGTHRTGIGFGAYIEGTGLGPFEGAVVRLEEDGAVVVHTGASSQGQGHTTVFTQICADALGVDPSIIRVRAGDTKHIRFGWGTIASRIAVVAGNAVAIAAHELREKILQAAATLMEVGPADVEIRGDRVVIRGAEDRSLRLADLVAAGEPGPRHTPGSGNGLEAEHYYEPTSLTWAGGVHAAVVDIDIETGVVTPTRYVVVHDAGRVINPTIVKGQVHGGVAQGLGAALLEEILYDSDAQILTVTLADYMIPTATEIPAIEVREVNTPSERNPLGVKGMGEGPIVPPPAVIANAVESALSDFGVTIDATPLTPDRILSLIDRGGMI